MKRSFFGLGLQANRSNRHQPTLQTLMGEQMGRRSIEADQARSFDSTLQKALEMQNADIILTDVTHFGAQVINPQTGQDANMFISTSSFECNVQTYNGNDVIYINTEKPNQKPFAGGEVLYDTNVATGGGDDKVYGSIMGDYIKLGSGDDWAKGNKGKDRLKGHGGNDYLDGGEDNDYCFGGTGADILIGASGKNHLDGGLDLDPDTFIVGLTGSSQDKDYIRNFRAGDKVTLMRDGQLAQWGDWVVESQWVLPWCEPLKEDLATTTIFDAKTMDVAAVIYGVTVDDLAFTNGHTVEVQLA